MLVLTRRLSTQCARVGPNTDIKPGTHASASGWTSRTPSLGTLARTKRSGTQICVIFPNMGNVGLGDFLLVVTALVAVMLLCSLFLDEGSKSHLDH